MPFLKLGNHIINTAHIASVELHYEQPAFDPPDLDVEEPATEGKQKDKVMADLVRVHFYGGDRVTFYHDEAKALRKYFTDSKNISDLMEDDTKGGVGFGL